MLALMPLRCETHFGMGVPVEDQNVSVGLVRNDVLPPPPPHIPHVGRGDGNVHLAPQRMNFGDMGLLIKAMTGRSSDVVILAMVLVFSPMLGLVLECRCASDAIGVTLESMGGQLYNLEEIWMSVFWLLVLLEWIS
ncbi:hypothetical protein V6N11_052227 [Hibiscus sabdariffa]|uniref:Uncharacterized protein n=1 Tax=Hibiscus sabdariffa TaxID=183260 RepID=A0ABR2U9D9_9ROSI